MAGEGAPASDPRMALLNHFLLPLRVSLCRHLNIAIGFFRGLVNREKMVLNLFEYDGIVIDDTAVAADFHWCMPLR